MAVRRADRWTEFQRKRESRPAPEGEPERARGREKCMPGSEEEPEQFLGGSERFKGALPEMRLDKHTGEGRSDTGAPGAPIRSLTA